MFERFTGRARRVVVLAQEEARMLRHGYIGTEHLLLGLLRERAGVAARALQALGLELEAARLEVLRLVGSEESFDQGDTEALRTIGIDLDEVRRRVEEAFGVGALDSAASPGRASRGRCGSRLPGGHIPFTPRAKRVLELSLREALRLGHNYIGSEHILLGLVRENEGLAACLLRDRGVHPRLVQEAVADQMAAGGSDWAEGTV